MQIMLVAGRYLLEQFFHDVSPVPLSRPVPAGKLAIAENQADMGKFQISGVGVFATGDQSNMHFNTFFLS